MEYHRICGREELESLSIGDLFRRAVLLDVGREELDAAYSAVDTKAFLVEVVLPMGEDPPLVSSGVAVADAESSKQELQQKLVDGDRREKQLQEQVTELQEKMTRSLCSEHGQRCRAPNLKQTRIGRSQFKFACLNCGAEWADRLCFEGSRCNAPAFQGGVRDPEGIYRGDYVVECSNCGEVFEDFLL